MDLLGKDPAWMLLYLCGMVLTFNLGRDITLLVLFPFFFGLFLALLIKWAQPSAKVGPLRHGSGERRRRGMGPGVLGVPVAPGGAGKQD